MASPDFSQYVDLTVYDTQPLDIYSNAVQYARVAIPEFTPATGSIEDAIIQAGSYVAGLLGGAINRLPNGVLTALLQLFGVTRDSGTAPTGTLTITAIDNLGYTIPAGTRFGYLDNSDPFNINLYTFDTDEELVIASGQTSGEVAITGTVAAEYPILLSGTSLQLLTAVSYINTAALAADLSIGSDSETDATYLARGIAKLNSYTTALVLPSQFEQYILTTYTDVYRCKAYSRRNPANDDYAPTPDAEENGYLTIYVSKQSGASFTSAAASAIAEDVTDRAVAGLDITVKNATIVPVQISATVTQKTGYTQTTVQDNVEAALARYVHPDYWDWSLTLYYNELISVIDQAEGVGRVVSLSITIPSGATVSGDDFDFNKYGSLPSVTPTITVQA